MLFTKLIKRKRNGKKEKEKVELFYFCIAKQVAPP